MTDIERDAQTIREALNAGFEYWGHELDDVTGRVHALSPEAKRFEVAFAALARLVAALAAAEQRVDCGGVNCGKCQQCLTVHFGFAELANKELRAQLSAATTERDEAWDTLWRIANNAEAWHGPPEPETGHVRALRVIGEWARAALAAAAPATTAPFFGGGILGPPIGPQGAAPATPLNEPERSSW